LHGHQVRGFPPGVTASERRVLPPRSGYTPPILVLMPLYEFYCRSCSIQFEELVTGDDVPPCPACGSRDPERLLSSISRPLKFGLRGGDARRSDAARRARGERRRERRARPSDR
jgi:putative FmdB family regulatory protein